MSAVHRIRSSVVPAFVVAATLAFGFGGSTVADPTVDFDQHPPGTVLTTQYADLGGAGEGVVFGPLPGGAGEGLRPVIRTAPSGQAQSGSQVADIVTCLGCEFVTPRTTGTFAVPRSGITVYVGYLGSPGICTSVDPSATGCAFIRLRAFDVNGNPLTESSVRVTQGTGIKARLSVSTSAATIVGFEITARPNIDASKAIAIDDLSFQKPAPALPPDFTLTAASTNITMEQGETVTDAVIIGRLNGSTGGIDMRADGLPTGVTATFAPNPATGSQTVLTLSAGVDVQAPDARTVRITGSPRTASAGSVPRTFTLNLVVKPACPQVGTAPELIQRLVQGYKCVYVKETAEIDLAKVPNNPLSEDVAILVIPEGVTLMGGRSPRRSGGVLAMSERLDRRSDRRYVMLRLRSNTRVIGLRLRGYNQRDTKDRDDPTRAIQIVGSSGVRIENNEIFGWPAEGIEALDTPAELGATPRITRNFIHNNVQCDLGYGVVLSGNAFAWIDRNVFDYNRHDVAGGGQRGQGYRAELNFSLTSGPTCYPDDLLPDHYNQHYDMHGFPKDGRLAGRRMEIVRNTIRGAQEYQVIKRRPGFSLRGTPEERAIFADNAVHHPAKLGDKGAVRVTAPSPEHVQAMIRSGRLVIRGNRLCVDTAAELAVGDMDGDGRDDVFQAVGTLWVYSPSGHREWHFLRESTLRLRHLGLGDFDGDGKTDVFAQVDGRWLVSSGGTGALTPLPASSSIDIKNYRFADFDGDRKTDVFRADGSHFVYSSGAATGWEQHVASRMRIEELRFGDFDGDGKTDVFSLANNQWSVSYAADTTWRRLNRKLSSNLGALVFADFNGDRKTDVARTNGGKWEVSWGGATPWQTLAFGRPEPLSVGMLFGDFDADSRDDVLQHGKERRTPLLGCWAIANRNIRFDSFERYRLSSGGSRPLTPWSVADLR
jgi:FG-GAP-like repeat